ncbi:hypothetical protein DL96DRAFT_1822839 [Flagelloscypha sp. PMI_526]|nr:hypothetical protein DL96DRAFT_1822839 [Flagelloscypha sp. PMI_526]
MASSSSTEETRAAKRRRVSEQDSDSPSVIATFPRGHPWFDDGNLILQSNDGIRFKVYRGLLALHSTAFSDMLSFPQPPEQELVEGCPLVLLLESGAELTIFIQLMAGETGSFFPSENVTFDQLSIMLCLGKKYNIQRLGFDTRDDQLFSSATELEVAWLAFSEEIDIVLPLACYEALSLSDLPVLFRDDTQEKKNGDHFTVSPEFKAFLTAGIVSSFTEQSKLMFTWMKSNVDDLVSQECATIVRCRKALRSLAQAFFCEDRTTENGFLSLKDQPWWQFKQDLCAKCIQLLEMKHAEERRVLWEALPTCFGLPSWQDLRKKHDPSDS